MCMSSCSTGRPSSRACSFRKGISGIVLQAAAAVPVAVVSIWGCISSCAEHAVQARLCSRTTAGQGACYCRSHRMGSTKHVLVVQRPIANACSALLPVLCANVQSRQSTLLQLQCRTCRRPSTCAWPRQALRWQGRSAPAWRCASAACRTTPDSRGNSSSNK
jgi:hypothetical protein